MIQEAILWNKTNTDVVAQPLHFEDAVSVLADYGYMLEAHGTVVFCKAENSTGEVMTSYVVTQSMFNANNPGIELNDKTYTEVRRF